MKNCIFGVICRVSIFIRYSLALFILCVVMNFSKITHLTGNATRGLHSAIKSEKENAVEGFINVCRKEFGDHIVKYKTMRQAVIEDIEKYTDVIDEEIQTQFRLFVDCLEKMYTFSKNNRGLELNGFKKKMEGVLNTAIFYNEYSKLKKPAGSSALSFDDVKKGLYYMLDVRKSFRFEQMTKKNPKKTRKNFKQLSLNYMFDLTDLEFEFNPYQVIHSEHFLKEEELRKMYDDVIRDI